MGFGKGSRLFSSDKRDLVRLLTVALLSAGVISASLFVYQQITKPPTPNLISKDNAIQVAIRAGNWNEQELKDKKIEATLLHVKQNGFSFVVDQDSLQDTLTLNGTPFPEYENEYLWKIELTGSGNTVNGYWITIINAATGEVLMQG